ncbi:hypothetical protein [Sorangium cellulosum]|uniref:hypothetical protein n=1 Tax=Sorangium cellulosum TaxID=56 RepID=UPI0009D7496C|nr:hypothetical protein [Sorangium cellulosum]
MPISLNHIRAIQSLIAKMPSNLEMLRAAQQSPRIPDHLLAQSASGLLRPELAQIAATHGPAAAAVAPLLAVTESLAEAAKAAEGDDAPDSDQL